MGHYAPGGWLIRFLFAFGPISGHRLRLSIFGKVEDESRQTPGIVAGDVILFEQVGEDGPDSQRADAVDVVRHGLGVLSAA